MKKIKYLIVTIIFSILGLLALNDNVHAANQYGYPEAIYNGAMNRWEADLSQSPLYEGTQNMSFYNYYFWSQDPGAKNIIYNTISYAPGIGNYNTVAIVTRPIMGFIGQYIYFM